MMDAEIEIAQGSSTETEDILRCLKTLYTSRAGQQALDRDFGIDDSFLDYPMKAAKVLLTAELVEKTAKYEPRCQVLRVEWDESDLLNGELKPKVVIEIV